MNLTTIENRIAHIPRERYPEVGRLVCHFLDVTAIATARGSYYDSKEALQEATNEVHQAVFTLDRGVYGVLLALPGVLDHSRQKGVQTLLDEPGNGAASLLTLPQETRLIGHLTGTLPTQRALKLFGNLKKERVNNARTRRLILRTILDRPNLEWIAVKYRRKAATTLSHAWGRRTASIIKSILAKAELTGKEVGILRTNVVEAAGLNSAVEGEVYQCLSFILGNEGPWTLPKLRAFEEAKTRFRAGNELPPEVMEGIRSTYHPHRSNADVMELTERQATTGQRIAVQRAAREKGVEVAFDPAKYDLVRLYIYVHEMGMDDQIWRVIREKAAMKAAQLPMWFERAGILVDTSGSMSGHGTQKHRPIATALAIRDVLEAASDHSVTYYTEGEDGTSDLLPWEDSISQSSFSKTRRPTTRGHTDLTRPFLELVRARPETIFVISDGYENAPAGRFAEAVDILREMGNDTPIYQLSPVMDATTYGTRVLANDVPVLPINKEINLGMGLIKLVLEQDFIRGLGALIESTNVDSIARLESGNED